MPRPAVSLLNVSVAIAGLGLLIYTVQRVGGWPAVVSGVASVGWWFPAVIALGAARVAVRARAWMLCANQTGSGSRTAETTGRLSFADAFGAILAGDAAGNLTPLGLLASEPTKVMLTRARLSTVASIASVTIENAFYTASVLAVLLGGTWLFLQRADVPAALEQIAEVIIAAAGLALIVAAWAARTRPAVLSRLAPIVTRLARRADAPADAIREVEARIYGVLQWPLARTLHVAACEATFHVLATLEVWLVLRLLPGGSGLTIGDAFLMESAGRFVTIAFKFVPYRLGIDEVGSGAVAQALGLSAANGVTLALVRRLRILVLNAVGLIGLVRR